MAIRKTKPQRPDDILFELDGGGAFLVKPYTRGQLRDAIALDPEKNEIRGPVEASTQRALQLEALVGPTVRVLQPNGSYLEQPSGPVLGKLTPGEEMQMLAAILANGNGQDPNAAVALHEMAKKKAFIGALIAYADSTMTRSDSPSNSGGQ